MRGKVAKAIRKEVYGDLSLRSKRIYFKNVNTGQILNDPKSPRAIYQQTKRYGRAFCGGKIDVYRGSAPATADETATGTQLCSITTKKKGV